MKKPLNFVQEILKNKEFEEVHHSPRDEGDGVDVLFESVSKDG